MATSFSWTIAEPSATAGSAGAVAPSAATQPRDLKLDTDGDLFIGGGDLAHTSGLEAVAQSLRIRLGFIRGEWFLDPEAGLPLFDQILVKNPRLNVLRGLYRDAILATPGVLALPELELTLGSDRKLTVTYRATTDLGELAGTVAGSP